MREFLKGLELDSELIDTIMAEHGKLVTRDKEELQTLKSEISGLKENSNNVEVWKTKFEELDNKIKAEEETKRIENENNILYGNIENALNGKKFTSKYAKDGFFNDVKNELSKTENMGKGINEIIEYLSKDQVGIFESPNKQIDMADFKDIDTVVTKDNFNKMSYAQRLQLKQDNPDLFEKLNN